MFFVKREIHNDVWKHRYDDSGEEMVGLLVVCLESQNIFDLEKQLLWLLLKANFKK